MSWAIPNEPALIWWKAVCVEITHLGPGDEWQVVAASALFDGPADPDATHRFLSTVGHHLLIAYETGRPAGFISGVEMIHPDKGTEMFVYELGVDEAHRCRGFGRALVERLAEVARERGCYGMWVMTDDDNDAALATYRSAAACQESSHLMLSWSF
jgi:ribosomal protein S18 acetylase RimI-like enzyme